MGFQTLTSYSWSAMAPEFIILGVAALLSMLDLFMPKNQEPQHSWLDWHCRYVRRHGITRWPRRYRRDVHLV